MGLMFASRWASALALTLAFAAAAHAADEQRLSLLAQEAADLLATDRLAGFEAAAGETAPAREARFGSVPPSGVPGALPVVWGMLLTALLSGAAAYGGVRFGQRRPAGAMALATRDDVAKNSGNVREVTWRFRSSQPLRMGSVDSPRVNRVLDEIEDLGRKLRSMTSSGAHENPAVEATLVPAGGELSRVAEATEVEPVVTEPVVTETVIPEGTTTEEPITEGAVVEFARRDRPEGHVTPAAAAAEPGGPRKTDDDVAPISRTNRYDTARSLLQCGADHATIQAQTGLKFAEIDLLRCTTAAEGSGA